MDAYTTINTRKTPQKVRADKRQVKNNAGGFTFQLDDLARLRRFLILGSDGNTYYTSAKDLTRDNAEVLFRLAETNHRTMVDTIVDVSVLGKAPKANPAIFALAVAVSHGTEQERAYAYSKLSDVCRIATHLFLFMKYTSQFLGQGGNGMKRAISRWYLTKTADQTAYQAAKYRSREQWTHRDVLRVAHPFTSDPAMKDTFDWICRQTYGEHIPPLLEGFRKVHEEGANVPGLIREYRGLSWEMLPDSALNDPKVWDALLDNGIPQTALMRQLPRLTNLGLLPAMGGRTQEVAAQLMDAERLKKGRVHPVNVLIAQRTYASGRGARSSNSWQPNRKIVDALNDAFYAAFGAVEPAGKRTLLALDVSGSMGAPISNLPISAREASAALALVTLATEPEVEIVGFTGGGWMWKTATDPVTPLKISARQRLDDVIRYVANLQFGSTDCAQPMLYAQKNKLEIDTFITFTDNETWVGNIHPHQALQEYRRKTGIPARNIVVGMTSTGFSVNDPSDPLGMDCVGFDSSLPNLMSGFSRGDF